MNQTFLYTLLAFGLFAVLMAIFGVLYKKAGKSAMQKDEELLEKMELRMKALIPELMRGSNEMLIKLASEQLGSQTKQVKTDLENKRGEIDRLVRIIRQDLQETQRKLQEKEKEQTGTFEKLKSAIDENRELTQRLNVTTEGLRKILSNNQLRGQFGEQIAEDLLKMTGFVKGTDYKFNRQQEDSQTRPDFTVFLPDGMRINVDVKFPFAQLQKMSETDDKSQKMEHAKLFKRDVKEKIKQIVERDYINPSDNTVDFAIMFIPNEMIFSYVYENLPDVWEEAMKKRIVLAGPFSFTAILRMIRQAYDNFQYQKNIYNIVSHVKAFEQEFGKFIQEFDKIGTRIQSVQKQYDTVAGTRKNQLLRRIDKVKMESLEEPSSQELPM